MSTLDWFIQDYTLGGLIATRSLTDIVMGYNSELIQNMPFQKVDPGSATTPWNYYYFKTGDAILYDPKITVLLNGNPTLKSPTIPVFTVNTGATDPSLTGKLTAVNGVPYPNRNWKVFTGQSSFEYLPFRCNDANFTISEIYTWMQG